MKKTLIFAFAVCAAFAFSSCKSKQNAAYRQAYEQAKAQEAANAQAVAEGGKTTVSTPVVTPVVTPVQPVKKSTTSEDLTDVRTIQGSVKVVNGDALKTFSVVVGSFQSQANAEKLQGMLKEKGYDARVIHTNDTVGGQSGWYRVVASSFDDKPTAAQLRDELNSEYQGAWLLYNK